ncbi:AhpC/TSA antioxidant enzyme-domain-containing protein [Mycena leptocephala]|nr:AhpC/TSA antioxidant enzyme-domain-containing protein [Mycena leptocephala]
MSLRDALPEASVLELASKCEVEDANGNKVEFGSIIAQQKTVVVFIRHFFCGQYVADLASVPEADLESAGTKIVVIGCGEWRGLAKYKEAAGFKGPIYADSNRKLYFTLGMDIQTFATTPSGQKKPSYVKDSFLTNTWKRNFTQIGGDFVFGPGNQCTFAHRMQHTQDHVEVSDLMKAAGVTFA